MAENFLDKLKEKIAPLKEKIPFLNRSDDEDDEDYEDDDEEGTDYEDDGSEDATGQFELDKDLLDQATNPQYTPAESDEKNEDDEDDEDDEEDEEEDEELEKAKKKKKIIYGFVALALVYLVADEFMNAGKNDIPEPVPVVRKNKKKNKNIKNKNTVENEVVKESEVVTETKVPNVSNTPVNSEENNEEIAIEKQVEKEVVQVEEVEAKVNEESVKESPPEINLGELNVENKIENTIADSNDYEKNSDIQENSGANSLDNQLSAIIQKVEDDTEKEKLKLEYVSPPNYENFGESLVYNCKGRHWACVNKEAHFQCMKNYKWAKSSGNTPECSNYKVLATAKDCRLLQLYNINMVVEIPDCK